MPDATSLHHCKVIIHFNSFLTVVAPFFSSQFSATTEAFYRGILQRHSDGILSVVRRSHSKGGSKLQRHSQL